MLAEAVIIKLNTVGLDESVLQRFRDVCKAHTGACCVFVRIQSPGGLTTMVRCGAELNVSPDAGFVTDVEALLGEDSVDVKAAKRRSGHRPASASLPTPSTSQAVAAMA